jgi:antagonist of KipI
MLEVLEAGGLATLQDAGRLGWRRYGVPAAGPMDALAFRAANLLAGNEEEAAALEVGAGDLVLRATYDCVVAVTGAGYQLSVGPWDFELWSSYFVRGGWTVQLKKVGFGMWAYVAVAGGLEARRVLSSRSTYVRGRFGGVEGRLLQAGDELKIERPTRGLMEAAGRTLNEEARPSYRSYPIVDVVMGPQSDQFDEENVDRFLSGTYWVSGASDRMGYRLQGPRLERKDRAELTSEGMAMGSIQVPADGQPIVMMADSATTGGYPKIACVTRADAPLLAQCMPGRDEVRFRAVSVEAAQEKYREAMGRLRGGMEDC